MEILDTKEQEDGSLILDLSLTNEEINIFVELGFNEALKRGIEIIEGKLKSED